MKVLHVIADRELGGGNVNVARLVKGVAGAVDNVVMLPADANDHVVSLFKGVTVAKSHYRARGSVLSAVLDIARAAREADVIHAHGTRAALMVFLASRLRAVPWIYTVRGYHLFQKGGAARFYGRHVEALLAKSADQVVYVSYADRDLGLEKRLSFRKPPLTIENGIDVSRPDGGDRKFDVAFIGRMEVQKDPVSFVEVLTRQRHVRTAVVAGSGTLSDEVDRGLNSLSGIQIERLGEIVPSAVLRHLGSSRIFVMTSRWEGMPTIAIEALLSGCHVVGFSIPPLKEIFGKHAEKYLVAERDPEALAKKIDEIVQAEEADRGDFEALISNVKGRFSVGRMSERYLSVYEDAANLLPSSALSPALAGERPR